jgi:LAO/AO transport system kinase
MREPDSPRAEDAARRAREGDERALARLLSALEDGEAWAGEALRILRKGSPRESQVIGVTGAPGTGKSTLIDRLIRAYRERGERVAVLAVDPSSPFTGGAILGDRVRMRGLPSGLVDEGVFIRSLATRGRLGGLSRATAQCARALEAAGYGIVIVETVGIGQSEVDIVRLADSVVLVSMPGSGDDIQTIKAGVMEIGDVFVVNKADRDGAERAAREIRAMLETGLSKKRERLFGQHRLPQQFPASSIVSQETARVVQEVTDFLDNPELPPVLETVAESGKGVDRLVAALDERWAKLKASGGIEARRRRGAVAEARELLGQRVLAEIESLEGELEDTLADDIVKGAREAAEAADILFDAIAESRLKGKGEKS